MEGRREIVSTSSQTWPHEFFSTCYSLHFIRSRWRFGFLFLFFSVFAADVFVRSSLAVVRGRCCTGADHGGLRQALEPSLGNGTYNVSFLVFWELSYVLVVFVVLSKLLYLVRGKPGSPNPLWRVRVNIRGCTVFGLMVASGYSSPS